MNKKTYYILILLSSLLVFFQNCGSYDSVNPNGGFDSEVPVDGEPQIKVQGSRVEYWANDFQISSWYKIDKDTFRVISPALGIDKNYVYCKDRALPFVDLATFEYMGHEEFYKDKNGFYKCINKYLPHSEVEMSSVAENVFRDLRTGQVYRNEFMVDYDWDSLRDLPGSYLYDKNYFYHGDIIITENKGEGYRIVDRLLVVGDRVFFGVHEMPESYDTNEPINGSRYTPHLSEVYYSNYFITGIRPSDVRGTAGGNFIFTEDKVFRNGSWIKDIDPSSFRQINSQYYRDADTLYLQSTKIDSVDLNGLKRAFPFHSVIMTNSRGRVFANRSPEVFMDQLEMLSEFYARHGDEIIAFPYFYVLANVDAQTFEIFEEASHYAKDKDSVFYRGNLIEGANPATFEVVTTQLARDQNNIYFERRLLTPIQEGVELEVLSSEFMRYGDKVFRYSVEIEGVDAATFEVRGYDYAVDSGKVYYRNREYEQTNPGASRLVGVRGALVLEDKVILEFREVALGDPEGFQILGKFESREALWRDSTKLYFDRHELAGADPENFEIIGIDTRQRNPIIQSNGRVFVGGAEIPTSDLSSVKYIGGGYIESDGQVYYNGQVLEGVSPLGFGPSSIRHLYTDGSSYYSGPTRYYDATGPILKHVGNLVQVGESFFIQRNRIEFSFTLDQYEPMDNVGIYDRIADHILYRGVDIEGVDASTFEVTGYSRGRDVNQCYNADRAQACN